MTDDIVMIAYAVGKVYGLVSSDQFCFQENEGCLLNPLEFLLVDGEDDFGDG